MKQITLQERFKQTYQNFFAEHKMVISIPIIIENIWTTKSRGISSFSTINSKVYLAKKSSKTKKWIKYYDYQKDKRIKEDQQDKTTSINILSETNPKLIKNFNKIIIEWINFLNNNINNKEIYEWEKYTNDISYSAINGKNSIIFDTWHEKIHRTYNEIRQNNSKKEQDIRICYISEETNKHKNLKIQNKQKDENKSQKYSNEFLKKLLPRQRPQRDTANTDIIYKETEAKRFLESYCINNIEAINTINQISLKHISEIKNKDIRNKILTIYQELNKEKNIFISWWWKYFKIINIKGNEKEHIEKNLYAKSINFTKSNLKEYSIGIKIEQNIEKRIINKIIPKNSFILNSHNEDCKIWDYEELCKSRWNDIIIDPIYNKIFILWKKVNSDEIHSQTMTVEILSHLLENINISIPNTKLSPSSYSKNKNDMFSKIVSPLRKITKQKIWKEIPLTCSGSLHDFNIKLKKSKIKFGIIKEFN